MFIDNYRQVPYQAAFSGRSHAVAALVFAAIAVAGFLPSAPVALILAHSSRNSSGRMGGIAFAAWVCGIVGTVSWLAGLFLQFVIWT